MKKSFVFLIALLVSILSFGQTKTVGTTGADYATLKAAFDAINAGTVTGTITLNVIDNTTETATAVLNASGSGSASYTSITISPSGGGARTISGAITAGSPLIDFSGADNVTINGLNSGGNSLTISNTTASATSGTSTVRFIGGAINNTITNCTVLGSFSAAVGTNGGNIFFSTDANTANGNDNNTISYCNIGPAGSNLPTKGIYGNGSTTTTALGNSGITIDNNNIYDCFGAAVTSSAIYINGGCNTWSITNNKIYQTATRTWTTGATHSGISIQNSTATSGAQGFTVTGNIIGYATNTQTGTYTLTGSTGKFVGIEFNGITLGTVSNINSNTVASVSLTGVTSSGTSTSSPFKAIFISSGVVNSNNNTIGSQSATASLTYSTTTTTSTDVYGMLNFSGDVWTSNSNVIGGISVTNAGASGTFILYVMRGFTGAAVTWTANSNLIGGTVANSIQLNATGTSSQLIGMGATTAPSSFTSNTIRNLTSNIGTGTTSSASVIGINVTTSTPNHTLTGNIIYNLYNSHATAATVVTGIQFTGSTANVVERNFIYGLSSATTSTSAEINGIRVAGGTTTYRNNMIVLGAGVSNAIGSAASNSGVSGINGINEALGTDQFFHNSVYIGGTATSGSGASYAFNGTQTTNTRSFRDNIFFNARTNSGASGKHYAVKINGTAANPTGLTINNNIYYTSGTGGVFGYFNSLDVANLIAWRTAVGQDAASFETNPQYLDPANSTPDLHINPSVATAVEGNGFDAGVTNDYDNQTRASYTPVDIGADAGNFTGLDLTPPSISYTTLSNTISTSNRNFTSITINDPGSGLSANKPRLYFKKSTDANTYAGNSSANNGWKYVESNGTTSPFDFTIDYSLLQTGNVSTGDIIQYFVVAEDAAPSPNVGINSGLFALTPASVALTSAAFPLTATINQYVISTVFSGNYNVPGSYPSLTGAGGLFATINTGVLSGNVTVNITADLTEDGSNALNQWTESGAGNYTLTIQPDAATGRTVSGTLANGLIRLDGADRVTIDGRSGGSGKYLTFINNSTGGSTFTLLNDATNNTIKYCNIKGVSTAVSNGTVVFSTTTGTTGNDGNTVDYCDIFDGATKPDNAIYSAGTAGKENSGNTISNCNIYNFNGSTTTAGVFVSSNNTDWTITGNSFYQTAAYAGTASTTAYGIYISSGNNHVVSGNYIGGSAASCGSTAWTINGTATSFKFTGIYLSVGTTTSTSVQNNTIKNIYWTTSATATTSPGLWCGINSVAGNINMGNVTGNKIGETTGNASITIVPTATATGAYCYGISNVSAGSNFNISNNSIGSVTMGDGISTTALSAFYALYCSGGTTTSVTSISNNLIGSLTTTNSIYLANPSTSATNQFINCLYSNISGTTTISNNTVANVSNNYKAAGATANSIFGIFIGGGSNTVTGNTIRDLSSSGTSTGTAIATNVCGLFVRDIAALTGNQTISANTIYNLSNTASTAAVTLCGIYFNATASLSASHIIEKNNIYNLNLSTSGAGVITGLAVNSAGNSTTVKNNFTSIGNNLSTGYIITGINDIAGSNYFYFNSVYIGGTAVIGTVSTYAFNSSVTSTARSYQNNIFYNARSNGSGTGKHYAVTVAGTAVNPAGLTVNYNDYFANGTGGVFGYFNSLDVADLSAWKTAVGQDANSISNDPVFINPIAATPDLHITQGVTDNPLESSALSISGIISDFDNETRPGPTSVNGGGFGMDIGADEFDGYNANVCSGTPVGGTASGTTSFCVSGTPVITASAYSIGIAITYQWQSSSDLAFTSPVNISGQTNPASLNPGIVTNTTYYRLKVTCSNGSASDYSTPVSVTINANPTVAVSPTTATFCATGFQLLTASGADTYSWSPSTGLSATTGTAVGATPTATITYTVTGLVTATGCSNTATATITVNNNPSAVVVTPSSASVCANSIQSLVKSGGTVGVTALTELFNGASTLFTTGSVSGTPTATQNTTYYIEGNSSYLFKTASFSADVNYSLTNAIDLTNIISPSLTFSHICATEATHDFGFVQYSIDNGNNWTSFPTSSYSGSATLKNSVVSFDKSSYADWGTQFTSSSSTPGTAPATSLWKTETIAIPAEALSSTQFKIRFRLISDGSVTYYGWLIDNVSISGTYPVTTTWSPVTDLYTDIGGTVTYTGSDATTVYCKPTANQTYTVSATSIFGCTTTNTATITYNPATVAGSVAAAASPISGGQTATLTLSGHTGNIIGWEESTDNNSWTYYSVYINPYTPVPSALGTWYFRAKVQSGNCSVLNSTSATVVVNANSTTFTQTTNNDWNTATNWSNGVPNKYYNVTVPANLLAVVNESGHECNDLTVAPKGELTIVDQNFTIYGTLTLQSDATGTASLRETGTITYTNPTVAQRYIAHDNSWHLLSSPLSNQSIKPNFAPVSCDQTFDFYKWDETVPSSGLPWINLRATSTTYDPSFETDFAVGRGYLVAYSPGYSGGGTTHIFSGNLNTGDKTVAITNGVNTYNLIGNPYQSALDWNQSNFVTNYTATLGATPSLWIWNGANGNYGTYNSIGGGTNSVTNIIPPHQGFFVTAIGTGSLTIPNIARVHPGSQNFLKASPSNKVKLHVSSTVNTYSDEIIVNFNSNAAADQGAAKWFSMIATAPSLYTVKNARNFSINTLTAVTNNLIVPVGFIAGVNGNYSITASDLNSFTSTTYVYLKDLKTNTLQDLNQNAVYSFAGFTTDNPDRFQLIFSLTPLGINNQVVNNANIYVYDNTLYINANEMLKQVLVYNMLGQEILNVKYPASNMLELNQATGYYTVRVVTDKNVYSQKVYVK